MHTEHSLFLSLTIAYLLDYSSTYQGDNIGIVKGIPHVRTNPLEVREFHSSPKKNSQNGGSDISDSPSQRIAPPYKDPPAPPPYRDPPPPTSSVISNDKYKALLQVCVFYGNIIAIDS